ncbi:hypothetical protein ACEPAF_9456 [Sanghuangporus sanghuang]
MDLTTGQIVVASVSALFLYCALRFLQSQWVYSQIAGPAPESWLKGHFGQFYSLEGWTFHEELYRKYGGVARLDSLFGQRQLYVSDPLALHYICVKDQYIYEETDVFLALNKLRFGPSLLSTLGDEHKKQRKLLNPVFHIKHMRNLLPVFYPIAYRTAAVLENEVKKGKDSVDVYYWISRGALEYIGQGGLGYSFDALDETKTNAYASALQSSGPLLSRLRFFLQFVPTLMKIGPPAFRRKIVDILPSETVSTLSLLINTTYEQAKRIFQEKREALRDGDEVVAEKVGSGRDILSVLMQANMAGEGGVSIPEDELLAHMSTFIVAGHDTTSTATNRILHVLSQHPLEQAKLREEITSARKEHGELDYDFLMALPYLDAVCRETLRVYPPIPFLERTVRKDTLLPLHWPIKSADGKTEIKEIPMKKGTSVQISIIGANRNKAIWGEDADEWRPERWLEPLPKSVDEAHLPAVYSQLMTFLGGGRACIGFKFAELEMKVVLSVLLEKLIFEPGPEVYWGMSGIISPIVKETGKRGQNPLKVSMVKN